MLKLDIKNIEIIKDKTLSKDVVDEKLGILDISATLNDDTVVNIEMQMEKYYQIDKRITFYSSRQITSQLKVGQPYKEIKPVILVLILNYNMFEFEEYITESMTVAKLHKDIEINSNQKYYIVELPKFRKKEKKEESKLTDWLTFIDGEDKEGIEKAMERNEILKKACEELDYLNCDEETKRLAFLREKAIRDEISFRIDAIEQGHKEGLEKGLEEGIEKGKRENTINIAKAMLKEEYEILEISKLTKLSVEEIENIKLSIK